MSDNYDSIVVGAGFAGCVLAERLTNVLGQSVLVIDQRPHVGGSAHDTVNREGITYSPGGAHIFHTNAQRVVDYLSQFTDWWRYEHRVLSQVGDKLVPMPINRTTVNVLLGLDLKDEDAVGAFFNSVRQEPVDGYKTSEEQVVGHVGQELFDLLYRDYTLKHWGLPASALHASVAGRLPFRLNDDDRHFTDAFQAQPARGYAPMFDAMLEGIDVLTSVSWSAAVGAVDYDHVFFTGPIDEFFDFELGRLPFRSVSFEHHTMLRPEPVMPVGVINHPGMDVPWTRTIEWRHLTGQNADVTTVSLEFPDVDGDPYYPVPTIENWALRKAYEDKAAKLPDVTFAGRLGTYRYLTMDQTVAQALKVFRAHSDRLAAAAI